MLCNGAEKKRKGKNMSQHLIKSKYVFVIVTQRQVPGTSGKKQMPSVKQVERKHK